MVVDRAGSRASAGLASGGSDNLAASLGRLLTEVEDGGRLGVGRVGGDRRRVRLDVLGALQACDG